MKRIFSIMTLCAGLAMGSCSSGNSDEPQPKPDPGKERLEIKISPAVGDSRATDYGFETNDKIGLYVVNYTGSTPGTLKSGGNHVNNMRFTYNGTWTPDSPIYWLDNTTHADFYMYYPYGSVQNVEAHSFTLNADQSSEAGYKASDFLWGKAGNVAPTASATSITAKHIMSRVAITLQAGNGFTAQSLANASIAIKINGVKCESTINLANGSVTATGSATSVVPFKEGTGYKALVVPQSVAQGNLITVTADGRDFNLKKEFTFESGKSHKFTVTLSKTSNGVNVNIDPWGDDGKDNGGTAE